MSFRLARSAVAFAVVMFTGGLVWTARGYAEVVVLRDGTKLSGKCTATAKEVSVSGPYATITVLRASIDHVELTPEEARQIEQLGRDMTFEGARGEYVLGKWLDDHLQYERAEEHYRKAIEMDPDHAGARKALGYRKEGKGWVAVPTEQLARAMRGFGASAAQACVELGKIYAEKGQTPAAEKAYRRALVADPTQKEALKLIAPILAERKLKNSYRNPLEGKTRVVMGYDHPEAAFMLNALDLVEVDDKGRTVVGDPQKLESHLTFNAPVYAAAGGEVFSVIGNFPDTPVGQPGRFAEANTVCIKHQSGEFTLYAHLKRGSIVVSPGQVVRAGAPLGRVGNSGSGAIPHLHFCVYDSDGISLPVKFTEQPAQTK